jgi:hypothetical protein
MRPKDKAISLVKRHGHELAVAMCEEILASHVDPLRLNYWKSVLIELSAIK